MRPAYRIAPTAKQKTIVSKQDAVVATGRYFDNFVR